MAAATNDFVNGRKEVSANALSRAERDLDWWHNVRESQLGLRAAGIEPAIGGGRSGLEVEDVHGNVFHFEAAIVRLFDRARVEAVRRYRRVAKALAGMTERERELAAALYVIRQVPPHLVAALAVQDSALRAEAGGTVLSYFGLLPHTGPFQQAFQAVDHDRRIVFELETEEREEGGWRATSVSAKVRKSPGQMSPLEWLSDWACRPRVEKGKTINSKLPKWVGEARSEAKRIRQEILKAYALAALRF